MRKNAKYLTRLEAITIAKEAYNLGLRNGWEESAHVSYYGSKQLTGEEFTDWVAECHPNLYAPLTPQK